jgi:hypothetical protein
VPHLEFSLPVFKRAALAVVLLVSSAAFLATPSPSAAATQKVAIIVGPTAISMSNYVPSADKIAATASAAGATVVKAYCANATPAKVLAAVQGANIIVYLGHGNGYPNPYSATLDPNSVNGWGLAKGLTGCTDTNLKYYGEAWIKANAHPAPGFKMIYSNACYTPGAGETRGASEATAKARVGYYSRTVLGMGAGAYFASDMWQGSAKLVDLILRNPGMTYGNIFRAGNGFSATALRTFTHPNLGAPDQVWIQKTTASSMGTDYWYAFAGNPAEAPGTPQYGLPTWPAYARSSLTAAQDYAYRIMKARYPIGWRTGPPRWGRSTWPNDYRTASYTAAAGYSLRILIAEARAAGVAV